MHKLQKKLRRVRVSWQKKISFVFGVLFFIFVIVSWENFFQATAKLVPDDGGILTESTIGTTKNLNPLSSGGSSFDRDLVDLIFSGLLEYNPITGQIEPALATFRVSEDGLVYDITLKNSAKFSNGKAVSTDDVLFTYESVIQNPNFQNEALAEKFEYVTLQKIDEKTVQFSLPEPNAYFPALLTTPILYAKSFENALIEEVTDSSFPANKKPIGTGPFVFENIIPEDDGSFRVFLKRNKHYFKKNPYIKQVVFYVYPNFDYLRFSHAWTTLYSRLPSQGLAEFQEMLFDQYTLRDYLLPRFLGVFFQLDQVVPSNLYFRNAMMFGTKKDEILEKNPGWSRVDSVFFFEGVEAFQETDFDEGRRILRDSGFPYNAEKEIRTYQKKPVKLTFLTSVQPPVYSRFAQMLAQDWEEEYDIEIDLQVLDNGEFQQALKDRDYDMVLFGQDYSENSNSLATWHSSQSGKLNLSNLTNQDLDFMINEIYLTGAQGELFELGQKLNNMVPAVPLATPQYNLLVSKDLQGFSDTFGKLRQHGDRFYGIENWHFSEKKIWDLPKGSFKIFEYFKYLFS